MRVLFSVIIPVKEINDYVRETIPIILSLHRKDLEIILLPNKSSYNEWNVDNVHVINTGKVGPADKRDIGASISKGEILTFLDDDSYPSVDIFQVAKHWFRDETVVALGGPGITPRGDSFFQKVSGAAFLSKFSGGSPERYLSIGRVKEINDWPSVNLMVRKKDFLHVGGFNSKFWPGEDTKLCLELMKQTKKKILYIPDMIVMHHRRSSLMSHLKQVGAYGLHRGFFSKKFPETSRRIKYFFPSMLFIYLLFLIFYFFQEKINLPFVLYPLIIYAFGLMLSFYDVIKNENLFVAIFSIPYIVIGHIWYGYNFILGLFRKELKSILR